MAKNQFIRARVAPWEKYVISENAKKAQLTESEFVRRAALEKNVVVIDGAAEPSGQQPQPADAAGPPAAY